MMSSSFLIVGALGAGLLTACGPDLPSGIESAYNKLPDQIDFNYHVKPIISDTCYPCHGPDENSRKAELRLDTEDGAFKRSKGGHVIKPHKPFESLAILRILSDDSEFKMPPSESKLALDNQQIATLIKWVDQGAEWKRHWSFIPPVKAPVPTDFPADWITENEIDSFIHDKIQQQGLEPSPRARKERLVKRVTLDLTGLPPTLEEIDNFLSDTSYNAYEKLVDRLLSSDAHAERLAMEWLDVSRYADSHGMHADGYRHMWPWRDWVIKAFKNNLPYNEFVTLQLAGDLLPDTSTDNILATAFNRNHPMTDEGGAIDEEFRLKYVADRTSTIGTALLGLTIECSSCHDHKFDPLSQKEFYQMSAFFNNVKELGMTGADGNYGPMLLMADPSQEQKITEIKNYIHKSEGKLTRLEREFSTAGLVATIPSNPLPQDALIGYYPFDSFKPIPNQDRYIIDDNLQCTTKGKPKMEKGRKGNAIRFTGEYDEVHLKNIGIFEMYDPFSVGVWINTTKRREDKTQTILGNSGQKNNFWRGWDFHLDSENRLNLRLINSLPHNYLQVATFDSIPLNQWTHVLFTYNGAGNANGVTFYINGKKVKSDVKFDRLYKTIKPIRIASHLPDNRPLQLAKSYRLHTGEFGIFQGCIDELSIYNKDLSELEAMFNYHGKEYQHIEQSNRRHLLKDYYSRVDPDIQQEKAHLKKLRQELVSIVDPIDEVMVMEEMSPPRQTFILQRGQYDNLGEPVSPGTPESVLPFSMNLPPNRLGLASWFFNDQNPLTARVAVNRYWQMIFGRGLVATSNDFGNQGSLPSHPALLDWLAVDFMESDWNLRAIIKKMVMSATYQQTSVSSRSAASDDPENILLSHSPSYRWPAEIIRDYALAVSGLLNTTIGGASVKPYQPEGLWRELSNFSKQLLTYKRDSGENLYRRSMYTFIRRSSPPPFMTIFDAPNRDVCTVKRERTNTPLQALVLLNDPQFIEASKALAQRILSSNNESIRDQITYAFRIAIGRDPLKKETDVLSDLYTSEQRWFRKYPDRSKELLNVGEMQVNESLEVSEVAAMTIVANTLLNHDEIYMKR